MEEEVRGWIVAALPAHINECSGSVGDALKSGVVLCELVSHLAPCMRVCLSRIAVFFNAWPWTLTCSCVQANTLRAGSVKVISKCKMPFPQRKNVLAFINAARALGVPLQPNQHYILAHRRTFWSLCSLFVPDTKNTFSLDRVSSSASSSTMVLL